MTVTAVKPPPFGVYTPVVTFFNQDESIDIKSTSQHVHRLLLSGVRGLVIHGSNGEATHLLPDERVAVIRHVKDLIRDHQSDAVVIAGCSANSTRETLLRIQDAREAGADYALVLPPSYWAAAMTKPVIKSFYIEVTLRLSDNPFLTATLIYCETDCAKIRIASGHLQLSRGGERY